MLNSGNTLHFINRVDDSNCGDRVVCPLLHYYDYFKKYSMKRHDMRFIDFESISNSDVVIIGGGGMFDYAEFTNRGINKVLDTGAAVIAWSPGFNTHTEYDGTFETKIKFDRFKTVTVRDVVNDYGLNYLPDVTCKLPGLRKKHTIRREFGIARHKDYPIKGFDYDTITNECGIDEILQFIGESEIVISNSFHMIYWSILMGKRTICANPFSTRFYSYKYKPEYLNVETDVLADCVMRAQKYEIIDECIQANDTFFDHIKGITESRLKPAHGDSVVYDLLTKEVLLTEKFRETQTQIGDSMDSQLFIDLGGGFTEDCKLIAISNVYGDEMHSVRYDLSGFSLISGLRFDPIESRNCEVEIISAKTADGDVVMTPQMSVRVAKWDRFLTTDPQYFIGSPCTYFLEIVFRFKIINSFEANQNLYLFAGQKSAQIEQITVQLEHQSGTIGQQAAHLQQLTLEVGQQRTRLEQQREHIEQLSVQNEQQTEKLVEQFARVEQQSLAIEQHRVQLERKSMQIEHNLTEIEELSAIAKKQATFISQQSDQIEQFLNSTSWKITAPLRAVADFLKRILKGTR